MKQELQKELENAINHHRKQMEHIMKEREEELQRDHDLSLQDEVGEIRRNMKEEEEARVKDIRTEMLKSNHGMLIMRR